MNDWEPLHPNAARGILQSLRAPWWIAGGWAVELFAGHPVREHADLDIAVLRRDQRTVYDALGGWELAVAYDGALAPWDGSRLPDDRHGVWARPRDAARWLLELLFEDVDGDEWQYRRDARVTRPLSSLGQSGGALPPEVALLYASKEQGRERDWNAVVPLLDSTARAWLAGAVEIAHPQSPYLALL